MILVFPYSYGDSVSKSSFYRKYDGYGTFKYSERTYSNVVRIKTQFVGEEPLYTWYLTNPIRPIAEYESNGLVIYGEAVQSDIQHSNMNSIKVSSYPSFLRIEGVKGNAILSIVDMSGKVCVSKQVENNEEITTLGLLKGFYMVSLTSKNESFRCKIVR
jgi:hypothetical protein